MIDRVPQIVREAARSLSNCRTKNGVHHDGARRSAVVLAPGVEIGIGGITWLAESPRPAALRELLACLIGWSDERREDMDIALRSARRFVETTPARSGRRRGSH